MTRRIFVTGDPEPPERPAREPDARCDECGAIGTIARATRDTSPPTVFRFCSRCWPEARSRLAAEWGTPMQRRLDGLVRGESAPDPPPPSFAFESAAWSDVVEFVGRFEVTPGVPDATLSSADLRGIVERVLSLAPNLDGPMPPEVQAFVQRYGPPAG